MLQAYRRAVAAVAGIMASSAVFMQPWSDGGGALLGASFGCTSSAAGLGQPSQDLFPMGTRRGEYLASVSQHMFLIQIL